MNNVKITLTERRWITAKWEKIRDSQQKADRAAVEWERRNAEMNDFLDRSGETDIVQRDKVKSQNLKMKGALATHDWNAKESSRHLLDLQVFLKMKELGL